MSTPPSSHSAYDPAAMPGRKRAVPAPDAPLVDPDGIELPSFDPRYSKPFEGLLYLGALTKEFTWLGHNFVIRTIGPHEQLAIALVVKPYVGTPGEQMAYTTAVAAMCTVTVDGVELPTPIGEDAQIADWAHRRFTYVGANWFAYTIARVFQEFLELEDKVAQVIAAMGKAYGSTGSTPGSNDSSV